MERRQYDKDFKMKAINLKNNSGKSARDIEQELGIPQGNLSRWIRQYEEKKADAFPGNGKMSGKDLEIHNLKRENAILKEEREILKKAMGIFSVPKR
jgi:transposase